MIIRNLFPIVISHFDISKCESIKITAQILQLQVWHWSVFIRKLHWQWTLDWTMDYKLLKTEVINNPSSSYIINFKSFINWWYFVIIHEITNFRHWLWRWAELHEWKQISKRMRWSSMVRWFRFGRLLH